MKQKFKYRFICGTNCHEFLNEPIVKLQEINFTDDTDSAFLTDRK